MAAWGYDFYLPVLKVSLEILSALEDKILIPKRPCNSGALARSAQRSTMGKKSGKLPIRENLVITCPYTDRPSAPQAYQYKIIQSTGMATQMQLKVLFGKKSHGRPDF